MRRIECLNDQWQMSRAVVINSLKSLVSMVGAGHLVIRENPRNKKVAGATSPKPSRKSERKFKEDVDTLIRKHKKVLDELAKE